MKHKVGRHIPHMQVDAGRAALQQTPSDNTAPRGGQEDEARPGIFLLPLRHARGPHHVTRIHNYAINSPTKKREKYGEMRLQQLRAQIDAIDDQILSLLRQRMSLAGQIRAAKTPSMAILRPERETRILQRLAKKAEPPTIRTLIRLWREILNAQTHQQKPIHVATLPEPELLSLARQHFGPYATYQTYPNVHAILQQVCVQKVGVLPWPATLCRKPNPPWWCRLPEADLRIAATLPFLEGQKPKAALIAYGSAPEEQTQLRKLWILRRNTPIPSKDFAQLSGKPVEDDPVEDNPVRGDPSEHRVIARWQDAEQTILLAVASVSKSAPPHSTCVGNWPEPLTDLSC